MIKCLLLAEEQIHDIGECIVPGQAPSGSFRGGFMERFDTFSLTLDYLETCFTVQYQSYILPETLGRLPMIASVVQTLYIHAVK